jgi:hypothetical protein
MTWCSSHIVLPLQAQTFFTFSQMPALRATTPATRSTLKACPITCRTCISSTSPDHSPHPRSSTSIVPSTRCTFPADLSPFDKFPLSRMQMSYLPGGYDAMVTSIKARGGVDGSSTIRTRPRTSCCGTSVRLKSRIHTAAPASISPGFLRRKGWGT